MSPSPCVARAPAKPKPRASAKRAFRAGMTALAGVDLAFEGHFARDTPGAAQIIDDMIEGALAPILKAQGLLKQRAGTR